MGWENERMLAGLYTPRLLIARTAESFMPSLPVIQPSSAQHAKRAAIESALREVVRGEVRFSKHDRMLYATDASLYQVEPLGVVVPSDVQDAEAAVRACERLGAAILPRGGGTSLAGQCTGEAVVIDFSANCTRVRTIDAARRRCVVDPGITVDDLNALLAPHGVFFAPDPATSKQANVGGCIGNNAAGARSIMFGRTSENLHEVEVLLVGHKGGVRAARLAKGSAGDDPFLQDLTRRVCEVVQRHERLIRERFPKTIRRNAGYGLDMILAAMDSAGSEAEAVLREVNLAHLICGSEGTLAVVTGACLGLHPLPKAKGLALLGFASVDAAIEAVGPILSLSPSAVELLDDLVISLAKENVEYRKYVELLPTVDGAPPAAALYVEFFGVDGAENINASLDRLRGLLPRTPMAVMASEADMQRAWRLRKAGEPLLHGMPGNRKPVTFVEDNAVPVENLGEFVRKFRDICTRHGTRAAYWAHASVGVLHIRPLLDLRDPEDERRLHAIAVEAADLAKSLGGVMSGEHGDGRVRGPLLERFYGPELMRAFREIKTIFDPRNLLNPGNIVQPGPIESITRRTRVYPDGDVVRLPEIDTYFEFADQHGLGGAVDMCNGAGVCRKRSGGTMCPSFMALHDERHATRGRANALRLAITGQFGGAGDEPADGGTAERSSSLAWNDPDTNETLRLCLSCKACKAECPSNVDVARLKAEYSAQGFRARGGAPISTRMMGHVRVLNRLGSLAPELANWGSRLRLVRWLTAKALNIDPRRSLPPFAVSLAKQWRRRGSSDCGPAAPHRPVVALFGDCFTMYNEPRLGLAAKEVLESLGYDVRLLDVGCCGRAMISMGALDDARAMIDATLARLGEALRDLPGAKVVFCEPSCLSAVKDDWLDLKLGTPKQTRRALAERASLVEDFVELDWKVHPRRESVEALLGTSARTQPMVLHGHCHQKALWGVDATAALLARLGEVTVLDGGCCGMAGSFGYMRDRYDLAIRIGERVLLPAARAAGQGGSIIIAPGTSCRHQIKDATGAKAKHPIEVVRSALGP